MSAPTPGTGHRAGPPSVAAAGPPSVAPGPPSAPAAVPPPVATSDLPPDLPPRPTEARLRAMGKAEARELSDALFDRLAGLARETHAYSYVRGTIVELNMPLVRFVAGRFRHRPEDMDDILQVGTVGLIKAVDGYDPGRGVEFVTYAVPTIAGEIKRFFRDTSWPVRVPRRMQECYLAVACGSDRLEQELGRPPRPEEIAKALDLSTEEVVEGLIAVRVHRANSSTRCARRTSTSPAAHCWTGSDAATRA